MSAPLVQFERVTRRFGEVKAVDAVDLEIVEGEFFALLGPSGCGKTTLMRLLAGFERPDAGRILLDGRDVADLPPHRRPSSMMFQTYALFPHLNVAQNIGFGLKQQGWNRNRASARVDEMLELVRLEGLERRKPDQLSGGQRQRVALARALAPGPKILLLDEPLAALDRRLREDTQLELKTLQAALGLTFMIVTHDQDEAMVVADRMAVMKDGRIVQVGPPHDVYEWPASRFVAQFIGEANLLHDGGAFRMVRPERVALSRKAVKGALAGRIVEIAYLGDRVRVVVKTQGGPRFRASCPAPETAGLAIGDPCWINWPAEAEVDLPE